MSESSQGPTKHNDSHNLYTEGTTTEIISALPTLFPSPACPSLVDSQICVIGGSIGGLCVAASLIQSGFSNVTVLERTLQAQPGAGLGLDDASLAILKGLGIPLLSCQSQNSNNNDDERKAKTNDNEIESPALPVPMPVAVQRMRFTEERLANGQVLTRQAYPYHSVRYSKLVRGLESLPVLANGVVVRGQKAVRIEQLQLESKSDVSEQPNNKQKQRSCRVHFEDSNVAPIDCDLVICADGSRSVFRSLVRGTGTDTDDQGGDDDLRYAGYTAWRGTIHESKVPPSAMVSLRREFSHYSNCLYYIHGKGMDMDLDASDEAEAFRQSAVLYDIGDGLVNWLVYEPADQPQAPPGRTTTTATPQDIELLHKEAKTRWGEGLGGLIECTLDPYKNDIYDIRFPLTSFVNQPHNTVCVLGDAAHPITPNFAKGSNLAIHDALVLAKCARNALTIPEWMAEYSDTRVNECRRLVLLSRHLGRVRMGMPLLVETKKSTNNGNQVRVLEQASNIMYPLATSEQLLEAQILEAGVPTSALPLGRDFMPLWDFLQRQQLPSNQRGIHLRDNIHVSPTTTAPPPPLLLVAANHISRGTSNVDRLVHFYQNILGLRIQDDRPDFGFGGAWLQLPGGMPFHIIESDTQKPQPASSSSYSHTNITADNESMIMPPERFIRRSEHLAFTVNDINQAKEQLKAHSIPFAVNFVPGTNITQLFLYDPDGNGVEIGNFDVDK